MLTARTAPPGRTECAPAAPARQSAPWRFRSLPSPRLRLFSRAYAALHSGGETWKGVLNAVKINGPVTSKPWGSASAIHYLLEIFPGARTGCDAPGGKLMGA